MFLAFDKTGWFNGIIRDFFQNIDTLIYYLLQWIVEGIFNLSNLAVNTQLVEAVYRRVYVILGIFMIFKLTFSFLKYMVSPDAMTDKQQGTAKLIANTVVMVSMLIILPVIFFSNNLIPGKDGTILNLLQNGVIKTLPKVIFGVSGSSSEDIQDESQNYGKNMALMMLRSFYYEMHCDDDSTDCDITDTDSGLKELGQFEDTIKEKGDAGKYQYKYLWPLSTVSGILLVFIMGGIAIDVAIRVFKLVILQMIAPIPVMTYIDPKSSKDGAFNSWVKAFISTYIDIFIKLALVYLVLFLINRIYTDGLFEGKIGEGLGFMSKSLLYVALTYGLLKFAKDAPKFIKDALGIKDSGGGGGFMGKALAGLTGAAAGFAGGVAAGGGLAGGLSSAVSGFGAGAANAGSGKKANIFGQTRDELAKTLGTTPGGMKGKMQQRSLQRRVNRRTGLNAETLAAAKNNMYAAAADEANATDLYNRFNEGQISAAENSTIASDYMNAQNARILAGQTPYTDVREYLYEQMSDKQTAAAKAKSNYEKANKVADSIGLNNPDQFMRKNASHNRVYRAVRDDVMGERNYNPRRGSGIRGAVDEARGAIHDRVEHASGGRFGGPIRDTRQQSDRDVSRGGFDPNKRS